ncbi:MAG: TIGR00266 family protein, partial [Anaerotignum sp.]|nr:TIGR00266 family protein [Anaerotignum sp.]
MKYRLIGSVVPAVEILLENTGESVFTQSGGMTWMTEGVEMSTNTRGGLMKGLGRVFAGESLFMANYTNTKPNSVIAFAAGAPGSIYTVDLSATGPMTCQKGAFLCAQDSVNLKTVLTKKLSAGFFGGEGFILQEISGSGIAFLEIDGDLVERELAPGEVLKVDTGNVVAFDSSMSYEIEMVKGAKNIIFGGEGLFLTKLT